MIARFVSLLLAMGRHCGAEQILARLCHIFLVFINRLFVTLFSTSDMEIIICSQDYFIFELPSVTLARRTDKFMDKLKLCLNSVYIKMYCICNNTI